MDYSTQLENNEQRCRYGSTCQVTRIMPGGTYLENGINTFGHIPKGAVIESFRAVATGWDTDVVVAIGTDSLPTLFLQTTLVDGVSQGNDQEAPVEMYFANGAPIVIEITTGNGGEAGLIEFTIDYSELDTTAGAYTS